MSLRREEIAAGLLEVKRRMSEALKISNRDPSDLTLIAVTKTYPVSDIEILRELGIRDFAENRDQEGRAKSVEVSGRWHFQGQIQSNKISSIAKWAEVLHSLDEVHHLKIFERVLPESSRMSIFIQVCLDPQPGRGGVLPEQIAPLAEMVTRAPTLKLEGLMAVAPLGENPESAFSRLAQIHSDFRRQFPDSPYLSAGMSGDFESAIIHGATHVRIGSSILGSRSHDR